MSGPELASVHGDGGAPPATVVVVQEGVRRSRRRRASEGGGEEEVKPAEKKNEYTCRFCSMKFGKSQALGGHMNRHRQEREKEQFEHAQQLVSSVQQVQRTSWSSLAEEMTQSPSGPGVSSRLSSHLSGGGATRQPYIVPPISFGTTYLPTSPTAGVQLPPSPGSICNYFLPPNASSCNIPGGGGGNTSVQNQHNQQQLQQWMENFDVYSNAASISPRSATPHIDSGSFHSHQQQQQQQQQPPLDNAMATSLLISGVSSSDILASMLRNSGTPNDGSTLQVSPSTPTSSQPPGTYDVIYNPQLPITFYNGGM